MLYTSSEDEEEKVASLLSQLHLESSGVGEVLKRLILNTPNSESVAALVPTSSAINGGGNEILLRLLQVILEGRDEKAR
ncbi:hypothetical protein ZOSMA_28G00230 [Zostera marina]|uniref:Uncharacterized protein n=1 Tax=Zostera marina TaxID=29655 RepID=A0A0K9PEL0_ZOSMR|nr:hypothetical protein ZOSMA_28G00230 [Zostera marina]